MKVVLCLAVVLLLFTVEATSKQRSFIYRQRRSLSWLPTFLGGSEKTNTEDVTEDPNSASDEPAIEPNVGNKHVNGQIYYPIWRVYSYDGVHFQPIPLSFVQKMPLGYQPTSPTENQLSSQEQQALLNNGASQNGQHVQTNEYPQELVDLAREYGFTDISRFPSLKQIGDLLGTTTQKETINTIKDLVSTQEGRDLIQKYIANGDDNEVAASEIDENVEKAEAEAAKPVDDDEIKPAETNLFGNYVLHNGSPQQSFLTQIPLFGQIPPQTEHDMENVDTNTPSTSYSDRIVQWANFLNPATNRQEIPFHISDLKSNKDLNVVRPAVPNAVRPISTASVNSNPLSSLQNIPGVPAMPNIYYTLRYPNAHPNVGSENGQYVLVKLPLASFNRSPPQQQIDPKYIHYAGNQRQPDATTNNRVPPQNLFQLQTKTASQTHWNPLGSSQTTYNDIPSGLQLPLNEKANYEVFKSASWPKTSYGTPASSYSIDGLNTIHVSPHSSAAFIHQEYDLSPAASEIVERTSGSHTQIVSKDQMSGNEDVTNKQDITSRIQETIEPSNNEQKIVQVESHKNDSNAYENKADVHTEAATSNEKNMQGTSMPTEKNIRHDLNGITVSNDVKTGNSHIQRITPHDKPATGKIYRADPKAMEMLPFTLRHMTTVQKKKKPITNNIFE